MWDYIDYKENLLFDMVQMNIDNYGLSQSISNYEFVIHEYFENPHGPAIVSLAYDYENNLLAGEYIICPHKFFYFGEEIDSVLSLDTLTKKEYRGQKIFTKLAEKSYSDAILKGYGFCYGAPNQNSYPGFVNKLGFINLCQMPLYTRIIKPSKIVKDKFNKFLSILSSPFNLFFNCKKVSDKNIVKLTNENISLMDDFWNQIKNKYPIIGVRDSQYILYRYLNVPTREYHPYVYLINGKPVAFVVTRVREVAKIQTGMIADFLYIDGYDREALSLVKFILHEIEQLGSGLAGCIMLSHTSEVKVLKKANFFRCPDKILPQPTPLILKIFNENLKNDKLININNWFFTTGDYDVV